MPEIDSNMSSSSEVACSGPHDPSTRAPRIYLMLENSHKCNNLGTILRCAAAFEVTQLVAVGCNKCSTHGSHGAAKHVSRMSFPGVEQAVSYLRGECDCKSLVGILGGMADAHDTSGYNVKEENDVFHIEPNDPTETPSAKRSYPVHTRPFVKGNCCFVVSKNPKGLPSSLASQCDFFIHIPHVSVTIGHNLRLLDAPSCLSIALHHFTAWALYDERGFQGHKYEKAATQQLSSEAKEAARLGRLEVRRQQMEEANEYAVGEDTISGMFSEEATNGDY